MTNQEMQLLFDYLDKDRDGQIGYNEFCELSEEKRKGLDPIKHDFKTRKDAYSLGRGENDSYTDNSPLKPKDIYLAKVGIDDLELLNKMSSLTSLKKNLRKRNKLNYDKAMTIDDMASNNSFLSTRPAVV